MCNKCVVLPLGAAALLSTTCHKQVAHVVLLNLIFACLHSVLPPFLPHSFPPYLLKSTAMSFDRVDENAVYQCTGQPHPHDIEQIVQWMLNEDFTTAYQSNRACKLLGCIRTLSKGQVDFVMNEDHLFYREISSRKVMFSTTQKSLFCDGEFWRDKLFAGGGGILWFVLE